MDKQIRVLIVDDEEDMRQLLKMYLENAGMICTLAANGDETYKYVNGNLFDIILLDIMMPGEDGFVVCEKLRHVSNTPIIFLSAKGEEWDKVKGLKLGADDYIVKPFSPGELVARIQAVLRRSHTFKNENEMIKSGIIFIDKNARKVMVQHEPIVLTLKEYEVLLFLIEHHGQALSREQLLEHVWGLGYSGSLRTVDTHIKTLRMKLGKADYIETVWGIGYKFEVPAHEISS
ncbi:response regulator transcription factor [Robertmurraya korlensis]|uniref:response regulator transcription factor n=1 Tax=Robertmurraya korlensis TaxID=519977 RepID=UPI00203A43DC|nr:response regulator transcription factor [Robertmurraya korlensis]MCM3599931.1 response regulator transcription factor [Robertmurraya korlensis]